MSDWRRAVGRAHRIRVRSLVNIITSPEPLAQLPPIQTERGVLNTYPSVESRLLFSDREEKHLEDATKQLSCSVRWATNPRGCAQRQHSRTRARERVGASLNDWTKRWAWQSPGSVHRVRFVSTKGCQFSVEAIEREFGGFFGLSGRNGLLKKTNGLSQFGGQLPVIRRAVRNHETFEARADARPNPLSQFGLGGRFVRQQWPVSPVASSDWRLECSVKVRY
jgi:hypothetical protein